MTMLVEGKDAVLEFLEKDAERIAGKPGVYMLVKDDAGNLIAFLAGRSFLGSGAYSLDGNRMLVQDGIVVKAESVPKE